MQGVFEVYVKTHFSAAHALRDYPGDCAQMHGHNWMVEAYVKCVELDEIGIGIDFRDIKQALRDVLDKLDHSTLNELPIFESVNPTSENIAKFIYKETSKILNRDNVKVSKVMVSETPGAGAYYWEE